MPCMHTVYLEVYDGLCKMCIIITYSAAKQKYLVSCTFLYCKPIHMHFIIGYHTAS